MIPRFLLVLLGIWSTTVAATDQPARREIVDTLDFFGLRRVSEAQVRAKLKLKEGDVLQRGELRALTAELEQIPGVQTATISPITVSGGGLKVFVGIMEEGVVGFRFRETPTGSQRLPEAMAQIYRDFIAALGPAVRKGTGTEDNSAGHSLTKDPDMRRAQETAIALLATQPPIVREVLKSSAHADDRRAAAWLLGYARHKKDVTADLVDAARDPDSTVRNNATRALGAIAQLAAAQPQLGIEIDPTVFLEMLGSVTWTDRNKATYLLDGMTKANPALVRVLRAKALPELIEMARWKSEGHAYSSIRILGRIAGWEEQRILRARDPRAVEQIIAAATVAK